MIVQILALITFKLVACIELAVERPGFRREFSNPARQLPDRTRQLPTETSGPPGRVCEPRAQTGVCVRSES